MSAPEDTRIARFLFETIGTSVTDFINDGSATMIGIIGPVATSLLVIYVLLWGAAMASGQISEPFTDGMKRIVRMCVLIGFALTVGLYQGVIADFFKEAPMWLASQMTIPGAESFSDTDSMAAMLDNCLGKGFEVAQKPWDLGMEKNDAGTVGITGEGLAFQGLSIVLYVIVVIMVSVTAGLVFVAYMALALLLAIGPLFILMAIFPQTQRWFEVWLGQAVNYMILFLLLALASGLLFAMLEGYLDNLVGQDINEVLMVTLKAVGLSIAMLGVLLQMNSVAAALGGGAAIQASNVAGKLAGMGMGVASAGEAMFGRHRKAWETANDPARSNARRAVDSVKSGGARARQMFQKRNTLQGT